MLFDPNAIIIRCDGAMDLDLQQTGGNGFIIEFPDSFDLEPIQKYFKNSGQGIHRLEIISVLEGMLELLNFLKKNPIFLGFTSRVIIYLDRYSATDSALSNPFRLKNYISRGWKTYEGNNVKDQDLWKRIKQTRDKLSSTIRGRVEIEFIPEKQNKSADKLSRMGKTSSSGGRVTLRKRKINISKRKYDGSEIGYSSLKTGEVIQVHIYLWKGDGKQADLYAEVDAGEYIGRKIRIKISQKLKEKIHRQHCYKMEIEKVFSHNITTSSFKEI